MSGFYFLLILFSGVILSTLSCDNSIEIYGLNIKKMDNKSQELEQINKKNESIAKIQVIKVGEILDLDTSSGYYYPRYHSYYDSHGHINHRGHHTPAYHGNNRYNYHGKSHHLLGGYTTTYGTGHKTHGIF